MIRDYKDKNIYSNFNSAITFSIIGAIVAVAILIIDLININNGKIVFEETLKDVSLGGMLYFMYVIYLILVPFGDILFIIRAKKVSSKKEETSMNNDKVNLLYHIIFNFTEYYFLIFCCLLGLISDQFWVIRFWARACGSMLVSHIFSWIATIFLIKNYKIVKAEFEQNPPIYIVEKIKLNKKTLIKKQEIENNKKYQELMQTCGFKFFIKYFEQIKNLPIKDVTIDENIEIKDKELRIKIIRQIIENNLVQYCCKNIESDYGNFLSEEEKKDINNIKNNN